MYGGQTSLWMPKHEADGGVEAVDHLGGDRVEAVVLGAHAPRTPRDVQAEEPLLPASSQMSRSIDLTSSICSARGLSVRSTNSLTEARKSSCSGP
jgi:hypothetical protein